MSSKRLTDKSSIRTMSGLAWVLLMLVGIVEGETQKLSKWGYQHGGGKLLVVFPGHSRENNSELSRASMCIDLG